MIRWHDLHLGLDLGQKSNRTAAAVLDVQRRGEAPLYHLRHLERFEVGVSYPEQVRRITRLMETPPLRGRTALVADGTGVGQAVVDLFREGAVSGLVSVSITGGTSTTRGDRPDSYHVPKRTLASTLQALLQSHRLKFAEGLPHADVLKRELSGFRVKVSEQTGHEQFMHRAGEHDDLVLSLALAAWHAERERLTRPRSAPPPTSSTGPTGW